MQTKAEKQQGALERNKARAERSALAQLFRLVANGFGECKEADRLREKLRKEEKESGSLNEAGSEK